MRERTTTDRLTWASLVDSVSSTFIGDEGTAAGGINTRKGRRDATWLAILIHPLRFGLGVHPGAPAAKYFNRWRSCSAALDLYAIVFALVSKEFTPTARADSPCSGGLSAPTTIYATLHPRGQHAADAPVHALAMKTKCSTGAPTSNVWNTSTSASSCRCSGITLMILALPRTVHPVVRSSFYMQMLPVSSIRDSYSGNCSGLKKKGAVHTLLRRRTDCNMSMPFSQPWACLTLSLGIYYLVAPKNSRRSSISATGTPGQNRSKGRSREKAR